AEALDDRDSARWPVLQVAILRTVRDLLTRMEEALRREEAERAAKAQTTSKSPAMPAEPQPSFRILE
ncbi:MAG TPA: hypothetical protein VF713_19265, partial [Thermoanaerobaculia bacterium]